MDGENKPVQSKEIVEKINKTLENYEKGLGIPKSINISETEKYLNISQHELKSLTAEECGEAAFILSRFATHIQQAYNKEQSRISWCDNNIKHTICNQITQYKANSYEERKLLATRNDEHARKLDDIRTYAQHRADRIAYLPTRIESMVRTLLELQQTKRRNFNG